MKEWIFSKTNKKKYKKQQFLKALKLSYLSRKKKLTMKKLFPMLYYDNYNLNKKLGTKFHNFNLNWLLKNKCLN